MYDSIQEKHDGSEFAKECVRVLLKTLCSFEEKEILVSEIGAHIIDGFTIGRIFDGQLYDKDSLRIL